MTMFVLNDPNQLWLVHIAEIHPAEGISGTASVTIAKEGKPPLWLLAVVFGSAILSPRVSPKQIF
jgi:hypothetical protein